MTSWSDDGYGEVEADVYYVPGPYGQYQINGTHWYMAEWYQDDVGTTWYDLDAEPPGPSPTTLLSDGSLYGAVQDWSANWDGTFTVSLSPLAWEGMIDNGFVGAGAAAAAIFIPGVGEVEIVVGVVVGGVAVVSLAYWWINHKNDAPPKIPRPARGVPSGTIPIDQMGWGRDRIHDIKDGVQAANPDWVGIAPNGDVITGSVTGDAENHGPWGQYTNR